MKLYVGVTDYSWYRYLSVRENEDINFWQPGGNSNFGVISEGAPFLFKLKAPYNAIAGVGFFAHFTRLPLEIAWRWFEQRNGVESFAELRKLILQYRTSSNPFHKNPNIGCIVLTDPIFFREEDWISVPADWKNSIVQGKSYDMSSGIGKGLWQQVEAKLELYQLFSREDSRKGRLVTEGLESEEVSKYLQKVRLGQGAFRVQLADAYHRRCAISSERTLPALEAHHIKPYARSGPHQISNGILLRADLHNLMDHGYLTLTHNLEIEVSPRIKQEYENGREYYRFNGAPLAVIPAHANERPADEYIEWHNNHVYNG